MSINIQNIIIIGTRIITLIVGLIIIYFVTINLLMFIIAPISKLTELRDILVSIHQWIYNNHLPPSRISDTSGIMWFDLTKFVNDNYKTLFTAMYNIGHVTLIGLFNLTTFIGNFLFNNGPYLLITYVIYGIARAVPYEHIRNTMIGFTNDVKSLLDYVFLEPIRKLHELLKQMVTFNYNIMSSYIKLFKSLFTPLNEILKLLNKIYAWLNSWWDPRNPGDGDERRGWFWNRRGGGGGNDDDNDDKGPKGPPKQIRTGASTSRKTSAPTYSMHNTHLGIRDPLQRHSSDGHAPVIINLDRTSPSLSSALLFLSPLTFILINRIEYHSFMAKLEVYNMMNEYKLIQEIMLSQNYNAIINVINNIGFFIIDNLDIIVAAIGLISGLTFGFDVTIK